MNDKARAGQRPRRTRDGGAEPERPFPSADEDRLHTHLDPETPQTRSPAYRLSYEDPEFLMRDELRGTRLQLEFLKPDILQRDRGIAATVVVFGSARIPAPEDAAARLEEAERLAAENPDDPRPPGGCGRCGAWRRRPASTTRPAAWPR